MRLIAKILLLVFLAATFAYAQTNNLPHVQHVVIVVQENRTPDNLFQEDQTLINNGAHIVSYGYCPLNGSNVQVQLTPAPLGTCWDTPHGHGIWKTMWAGGAMTGACQISAKSCSPPPPPCANQSVGQYCPAMTYVQNIHPPYPNSGPGILDPYFQIASQYGWANYMFQTNQGPSFPAHQFLLAGTSAPDYFNDPNSNCGSTYPDCWQWFAAENANDKTDPYGCTAVSTIVKDIDPGKGESPSYNNGQPCYNHSTLATLLDFPPPPLKSISWKYYAQGTSPATSLWTAPNAIIGICEHEPGDGPGVCTGQDWVNNVQSVLPNQGSYDAAPILDDIGNCNLPQVSWVIPDGNWSDHNDNVPGDGGPSWVATIVNAIGQSAPCPGTGDEYWNDTVILVTWDDWGGLYDDVVPPDCTVNPCKGYSNATGGQYVYGFRVPLMVVGAYAKPGYISGAHVNPPLDCQHNTYCHDFGSILNFIEYAFGTGGNPLGGNGGISPNYNYADVLVMDKGPAQTPYSLFDFFDFTTFHAFQPITGAKYPPDCFHHPLDQGCFTTYPLDPDNDANESN
jgi:hypothetical protein